MKIRAALAGMSAAAIYLRGKLAPIRKLDHRSRSECRPAIEIGSGMSGALPEYRGPTLHRQHQMQSEKRSLRGAFIFVEVRIAPLIGDDEVQPPVAVYVGNCDSARICRNSEPGFLGNVVIAMIGSLHEECSLVVAAHIVTRLEPRPQPRIVNQAVIRCSLRLQFRPAIDLAFH